MSVHAASMTAETVVVAVDAGKNGFALLLSDERRRRLLGPVEAPMTAPAVRELAATIARRVPPTAAVRVGVEAAGHYHRPLLATGLWPPEWELLELNPAHVTEQRRAQGRRRVKTDAIDLEAITELVLAGAGSRIGRHDLIGLELSALVAHRSRRTLTRSGLKNQLLGQLDRAFPGLTLALPDVLGTKVGRLMAAEFNDPARLLALGPTRFTRFAAARDVQVREPVRSRLFTAARDAITTAEATAARQILARDLALLEVLDHDIDGVDTRLGELVPLSRFAPLTTVPGWAVVRAAKYGAAVGDPDRWPGPRQLFRAAGLSPMQYESAGKRRDGGISREGSVTLRRALIDLGVGLWRSDAPSRDYATALRARGKHGGIVLCALAHRANRIAFALVRDQTSYDPTRWTPEDCLDPSQPRPAVRR